MDLSKSYEFFNPEKCKDMIHVIGCGSVGSTVLELLARFGLTRFSVYDFDTVEPKNVANQMFTSEHIGKLKTDAIEDIMKNINCDVTVRKYSKGWDDHPLDGYVFLAVDDIDLRRRIVEANMYNSFVKAIFDFRTGLTDGQHYAADWSNYESRKAFLNTMKFSHDDVKHELSACNVTLCVAPTVRLVCTAGVTNFINFVKGGHLYKSIPVDAFRFEMEPVG